MFFVPENVNPDDGIYLTMIYYGTEGWNVDAQHHDADEALIALADGINGPAMIVRLVDYAPVQPGQEQK